LAEIHQKRRVIQRKQVTLNVPVVKVPKPLQGFVNFIREQGVVGLAIALVLGIALKSVVDSLVNNIFNPIVGVFTGGVDLSDKFICLNSVAGNCTTKLNYGQFISDIISFAIIAGAVYFTFIVLKLDKLDKPKAK
jgi:large conductance mechanosensitive channel